jgi:hypothetical protein
MRFIATGCLVIIIGLFAGRRPAPWREVVVRMWGEVHALLAPPPVVQVPSIARRSKAR